MFFTDEVETHALSGVHFEIGKGDYLSIAGPSGCGKSTLLSILGLLDTPSGGRYVLNGTPVENLDASQRAHIRNKEIGFIFQAFNLIGDLTVFENVELPLTYRAGMKAAERKKRVLEALERVRMAHRLNHYPAQLSGGQQQRVAVARALVGSPSILLADEPTGNLDSKNGEQVMTLLADLHSEGATICIVTHDPRYADYADRKIHMFDGRVVDEETLIRLREEEDRRIAEQARRGRPAACATETRDAAAEHSERASVRATLHAKPWRRVTIVDRAARDVRYAARRPAAQPAVHDRRGRDARDRHRRDDGGVQRRRRRAAEAAAVSRRPTSSSPYGTTRRVRPGSRPPQAVADLAVDARDVPGGEPVVRADRRLWTAQHGERHGLRRARASHGVVHVTSQTLERVRRPPLLGRWIGLEDEAPNAPRVAMLSYGYWQARFGGDPAIVGKRIEVNGAAAEIVGVMPRGFKFGDTAPELILPLRFDRAQSDPAAVLLQRHRAPARRRDARASERRCRAHAADLDRAVSVSGRRQRPAIYLDTWRVAPALRPFKQDVVGGVGDVLWVVMAMIGIVLLIASANVANLLLVRGEGRARRARRARGARCGLVAHRALRCSLESASARAARRRGSASSFAYGALQALLALGAATTAASRRDRARRALARLRAARDAAGGCSVQLRAAAAVGESTAVDETARVARRERRAARSSARKTRSSWGRSRSRSCCS